VKNAHCLLICLLLCLNFSACKIGKKATLEVLIDHPTNFVIETVFCKKLSENLSTLSTQNDEVMLIGYFIEKDSLILGQWNSRVFNIQEENSSLNIDKVLPIPDSGGCQLRLFLLEIDTERSESELVNLISQSVNLSPTQIKEVILDDDLLGVFELKLGEQPVKKHGQIRFWGIHLMDEFEYFIEYSFK
jgi:hypothetical protein